jgi:hypothetical protein
VIQAEDAEALMIDWQKQLSTLPKVSSPSSEQTGHKVSNPNPTLLHQLWKEGNNGQHPTLVDNLDQAKVYFRYTPRYWLRISLNRYRTIRI